MSKLQRKAIEDHSGSPESAASASRQVSPQVSPLSVAGDGHAEVASPARDLMAHLNYELTTELSINDADMEKYPLKWTVIGLTLFCGLSWYGLLTLIL